MVSNNCDIQDLLINSDLINLLTVPKYESSEDWESWKGSDTKNKTLFDSAKSMIYNFYDPLADNEQEEEFVKFMDIIDQGKTRDK